MGLLQKLARMLGMASPQKTSPEHDAAEEAAEEIRQRFRERCSRFRRLLAANKSALEAMADVEKRLHNPVPFGMGYVRGVAARAGAGVFQMIHSLNALTNNAYPQLNERFSAIVASMTAITAPPPALAQSGPLVLHLRDISLSTLPLVGGKMANLGEIRRHVGAPVPDGFAVTTNAYDHFMREGGLQEEIDSRIQAADIDSLGDLFALSSAIQKLILQTPLPEELTHAISRQVEELLERAGNRRDAIRLALRSSAVGEDALDASFAGQYRSELNVHPDEVLEVWREIIASKYAVTAMSYRFQRGIPDYLVPMSVGVLVMVNAPAGGVAYTRNPVRQGHDNVDVMIINAVPGLPKAVVDGSFSPDTLVLSRQHPPQVLERHIAHKPFRFICDPEHGVRRIPLAGNEADAPAIDDAMASAVAQMALALEEYYGEPQDVEWAVTENGEMVILQSRPLKDVGGADPSAAPPETKESTTPASTKFDFSGLNVLLHGGTAVSPGIGMGTVAILQKEADILGFPKGAVLVVERAGPRWATVLARASAVIAEAGGTAGHLASVAREYGIPAIFGVQGALRALETPPDQPPIQVTVDAVRCRVYAGLHPGIPGMGQRRNLMLDSPVYQKLHEISRLMVPLNLLDPMAPEFTPDHCRTLHDITRFCHEKGVEAMFGGDDTFDARCGKQLKAGVKLQYWIVDMDDAFIKPVHGPVVELSNIRSAPLHALWRGMTAIPWAGPPAASASGFFSVVMESAMNRDLETTTASALSNQNFLMLSSSFMNLQARYGYHFCTVECQAGENPHENYVNFQFKGGAANLERRALRARMVGDLLEEFGFRVDVREDALFATAEGYDSRETLARTMLLGYLVIHTRQVDMIMQNAAQATALQKKLRNDMCALMENF